jgi:hypothetical protein
VGEPRSYTSANTLGVGYSSRLVTISSITPDGTTAIAVDRQGTEVRVPMTVQPAKGILPAPGEQWIVTQGITNSWTFAAIATSDPEVFTNPELSGTGPLPPDILPPPGPPADGSIPGSAIEPGSLTGTEIAPQSITNLNLATAASSTNIILDPQFTSSGVNAVRQADAGTTCTWTFASPNVSVAGGLSVCTLALMPSTLVPLYVNPGEQYYLSAGVTLPAGVTGVSAGIQFAYNDGSFGGPLLPVNAGANTVAQLVTIPAGVASAYVRLIVSGLASGIIATFTQPVCYITQGPNQMQPGSVGAANLQANSVYANAIQAGAVNTNALAANSVNASKIVANSIGVAQLQAGIVYAGIVDSTVVTGATIQNSTGNPKTSINPDGSITITNAAGIVIFRIGPDGTIYWYNSAGVLLQQINPGGTQLVYNSLTGPVNWDFEPPTLPAVVYAQYSAVSSLNYAMTVGQPVPAGSVITAICSAAGASDATGVTDSKGNTYTLVQSCTAGVHMQVFQAVNVTALTTSDTITTAYGSANTQQKNFIALSTANVLTASPLDFSAQATGTSASPSVTGTPANYGDSILFIMSNANAGGVPGAVSDRWQLTQQSNVSGQHYTTVYASTNVLSQAIIGSTSITSAAWSAVLLGYKAAPAQPAATFAPVPVNSTLAPSTTWADDGNFSCRVTKSGTASSWGLTFPACPVQPNSTISVRIVVGTLNIALPALHMQFTFWSGPNGTGSNLGSAFGDFNISFNVFSPVLLFGAVVPATAVSAVFSVTENQADTAGNWFLIDNIVIPGGLAYSNSPVATQDALGNQVDQGINFIGLPGLTNVFGVEDPYAGRQLMSIDALGNISGQNISAAQDVFIAGQSVTAELASLAGGLVNYGYIQGNPWPATPMNAAGAALFELDAAVSANRIYEFVMNPTTIRGNTAGMTVALALHFTTDGSTPTITSPTATYVGKVLPNANTGDEHPGLRCEFFPTSDGTYKFLVAGIASTGTYFFTQDPYIRCYVTDLGLNDAGQSSNNINILTTGGSGGSGGGSSQQNYTEHFYGNQTWSYNEYGLRNTNGTLYQGAYSGEGYAQHGWIQWSGGSLGNSLNTVLNYPGVTKITFRLLNQHTWYNSGMTVSLHSCNGHLGNLSFISGELDSFHMAEGSFNLRVYTGGALGIWNNLQAGGVTYSVLRPPGGSTDLSYYGYFWGGGNNNSNVPMLTVYYTH